MAAVVAAKIRKARKEEEEAKQHNLDFYQVPTAPAHPLALSEKSQYCTVG
jgi:hypothetical protein